VGLLYEARTSLQPDREVVLGDDGALTVTSIGCERSTCP
jgi:hypothetical protein